MEVSQIKRILDAISVYDLLDDPDRPKVVYTTQRDNKVNDKVCIELAGIAFDIDDPLRPVIPDDTHPNCRCYYVDQRTGQIVTDISSKRIKDRGMPSKKLNDKQRLKEVKDDKHNLTQKKMDLIIETMKKNEKWQSKSKNFTPSDDTGIRPLTYGLPESEIEKASIEKMLKWIKQL